MTDNTQLLRSFYESKLPAYLEMLRQMVAINSFTDNPAGVNKLGELTVECFKDLRFEHRYLQCENPDFGKHLVMNSAKFDADKPTIGLISHLDTVFSAEDELENDFHWRVSGDRIYGPGTEDIKGGTVMMLMVLEGLKKFYPRFFESVNWMIFLNAAEERLSPDFGRLCIDMLPEDTKACLVFEAGTINSEGYTLVTSRKGRTTFDVKVKGRAAHAGGSHERGANAIVQMAHTIQMMADFTDYEKEITFNPGRIEGGTVVNRVPHYAEAEVEMRAFDSEIFNGGIEKMLDLNRSSQVTSQDGYKCKVSVEITDQTPPWSPNASTNALYRLWHETAQTLGMNTIEESRGGLSDGNWTWERSPTLDGLGPTGANPHCSERSPDGSKDQEYVLASSFVPKALLNTSAILKLV